MASHPAGPIWSLVIAATTPFLAVGAVALRTSGDCFTMITLAFCADALPVRWASATTAVTIWLTIAERSVATFHDLSNWQRSTTLLW